MPLDYSSQSTVTEPPPSGSGAHAPEGKRERRILVLQAAVWALLCGLAVNFGNQGNPRGYTSGLSDHEVLSTLGIHLADPSKYAGDWFMESAPQPHWFFDLLTMLGQSLGNLGPMYFAFWVVGLAAFGLATAMLCRHWAPRHSWLLGGTVVLIMSVAPWTAVGTGNSMIAFAVPAVVGGNMVYLLLAMLVTGRLLPAAVLAPLVAIVHVQQGAVVAVILAATIGVRAISERPRLWRAGVVSLAATAAVVVFGLVLRPIAAAPRDFVEVCTVIIPYHCASWTWDGRDFYAALGLIGLSFFSYRFVARRARPRWIASVGLSAFGLLVGLLFDRFRVPVLGDLAESVNVYRLGAVVFPFAVFGMVSPLFVFRRSKAGYAAVAGTALAAYLYLGYSSWQLADPHAWWFLLGGAAILTVAAFATSFPRERFERLALERSLALALIALFSINAVAGHAFTPRGLDPTFISLKDWRDWGSRVESLVPVGEQIVAPPQWSVKTPTYRGVIADCKNIPYGGEAWLEWQRRIADLGGIDQCKPKHPPDDYLRLSAAEINAAATKYDVRYVVLEGDQRPIFADLERMGWRLELAPINWVQLYLFTRS